MAVIDNHKLTDILVIVNRYFGGTKLGASGLTKTYFSTADGVLKKSKIITKILYETLNLTIDNNLINVIMRSFPPFEIKVEEQIYGENTRFTILVRLSKTDEYKKFLIERTNGKIQIF